MILRFVRAAALRLALAISLGLAVSTAAAAASYVDTGLKDLTAAEKVSVASPKPVQLLFQFKTKGSPNPRAQKLLITQVTELIKASGLFSEVTEGPAPNGAVLSITIDNLVEADAAAKGFKTGLTFGLAGSMVTDRYVCTGEYISGPTATKIARETLHAIHTTVGRTAPPENGEKAKNLRDAADIMVRQIVTHTLNKLASDPSFAETPAPVAAAAPAAPPAEAMPLTSQ